MLTPDEHEQERLRTIALQNAENRLIAGARTEAELRKQSEWLQITLASIGDAVISTDEHGRITFMNGVAENLTGWLQDEALGRPVTDVLLIIDERSRNPIENPATQALNKGCVVRLANHTILIARDGTERPIDDSAAPIRDKAGKAVGAVLVFRDVTERKAKELAQARLAAIVESSQDAIVSKTLEGIILSWNRGAEQLFGYAAAEAIGQSINLIIPLDRRDEELEILARIGRGERVEHFETVRVTKDGRPVDISLTVSPVRDGSGLIVGASKIARDITDRKRVEAALREADKRKDQFIALLAHELRNPLAPLRNGLQVIRLAANDPQSLAQARELMERQLSHMVRLIDDLLDVARIGQNKIQLRREPVLLADVMSSAIETAAPAIAESGMEFSMKLPEQPVALHADLTRLSQVFSNLLTNSAKYTERGGRIWLNASLEQHEAVVTVRDTGIGIPAESLPSIFEMFSQVDRSMERATSGLGIGLALVKGLVEMHGGRVTAASDGPGQGSLFTVYLPVIESPEPSVQPPEDNKPEVRRRTMLIVDDNRDAADSLAMMLKLKGHEVRAVYSGREAIQVAQQLQPSTILMDIGMPDLNGYDTTQRIREQPWGKAITIIALTGWGQERDRAQSRAAGCDGHLVKPVNLSDLEEMLSSLR